MMRGGHALSFRACTLSDPTLRSPVPAFGNVPRAVALKVVLVGRDGGEVDCE
jgi:hypothetical protein